MSIKNWIKTVTIISVVSVGLAGQPNYTWADSDTQKMTVEADTALEWRRDDRQYIARGNAIVTTPDMVLKADLITAHYEDKDATSNIRITLVIGDGNADIVHQEIHGVADIITYDRDSDTLVLKSNNDTNIIRVTRGKDVSEAEDSIIYDRGNGIITSTGNSITKLDDGRVMRGDEAVTTLKTDDNSVDHIVVTGNVHITQPTADGGTQQATGQKAVYEAAADIVTVTGDVVLTQNDNIIKGGKAIMRIGEGESIVTPDENTGRVSGQFFIEEDANTNE
ncbi:MAG: hypothetical protein ISQ21_06300 [Alphaproteobacteria bacterium]|nr:hypothetical protein [Alphaproteobacteria bacterium]